MSTISTVTTRIDIQDRTFKDITATLTDKRGSHITFIHISQENISCLYSLKIPLKKSWTNAVLENTEEILSFFRLEKSSYHNWI